jgi:hypothetical protein
MKLDFDPSTCAEVENQLIAEGAAQRIVELSLKDTKGQFGAEKVESWAAAMICMTAAAIIFSDVVEKAAKDAGYDKPSSFAWLTMIQSAGNIAETKISREIKKRIEG